MTRLAHTLSFWTVDTTQASQASTHRLDNKKKPKKNQKEK